MLKAGANIWLTGPALDNPEFTGAPPTVESFDTELPALQALGSDYDYAAGTAAIFVRATGSTPPSGSGTASLLPLKALGADYDYAAGQAALPALQTDGEDEQPLPDVAYGIARFPVRASGTGYGWGYGDADVSVAPLQALGADYEYAVGDARLPAVRTYGYSHQAFNGAVIVLHGVTGVSTAESSSSIVLREDLAASANVMPDLLFLLREHLRAVTYQTALVARTMVVQEELLVATTLRVPHYINLIEALDVGDGLELASIRALLLSEVLEAGASTEIRRSYIISLAAALTVSSTVRLATTLTFEEALQVVVEQPVLLKHNIEMLEALTVQGESRMTAHLVASFSDALVVDSSMTTLGHFKMLLQEGIEPYIALSVGDEVIHGWVMNTQTAGFSEYRNFPFNSFAELHGQYYGLAKDGLYRLEGDTDDGTPIEAVLRTGLSDLNTAAIKDAKAAYIGYNSSGRLVLKVVTTGRGQKEEWWYELRPTGTDDFRTGRAKIGRGLRARYWQFEVVNVDGADFEIDDIELMYQVLSRRYRP